MGKMETSFFGNFYWLKILKLSKKGNLDGHKCHKMSKNGNILMAKILKCVIKSKKSKKIPIGQKTKITFF